MPYVFRRVLCRAVALAVVLVAVAPLVVRPEAAQQSDAAPRSARAFAPAFMPEEFAARRARIYESLGDDVDRKSVV